MQTKFLSMSSPTRHCLSGAGYLKQDKQCDRQSVVTLDPTHTLILRLVNCCDRLTRNGVVGFSSCRLLIAAQALRGTDISTPRFWLQEMGAEGHAPRRALKEAVHAGDKSTYTDKQKRKAEHIEEGYEKQGVRRKRLSGVLGQPSTKKVGAATRAALAVARRIRIRRPKRAALSVERPRPSVPPQRARHRQRRQPPPESAMQADPR